MLKFDKKESSNTQNKRWKSVIKTLRLIPFFIICHTSNIVESLKIFQDLLSNL